MLSGTSRHDWKPTRSSLTRNVGIGVERPGRLRGEAVEQEGLARLQHLGDRRRVVVAQPLQNLAEEWRERRVAVCDVRAFERSVGCDAYHGRPGADPRGRELADRLQHAVGVVEHAEPLGGLEQRAQTCPARLFRFEKPPALVDVDRHAGRADDRAGRVVYRVAASFEPVHAAIGPDDAMIEAPRHVVGAFPRSRSRRPGRDRRDGRAIGTSPSSRRSFRARARTSASSCSSQSTAPVLRSQRQVPIRLALEREPEALGVDGLRQCDVELRLALLADASQHGRGDRGDCNHRDPDDVVAREEDSVHLPEEHCERDRVDAHDRNLDRRRPDGGDEGADEDAGKQDLVMTNAVDERDRGAGEADPPCSQTRDR